MRVFFDATIEKNNKIHTISEEESKHIVRVLRMKEGQQIKLVNGKGAFFICTITEAHPKRCQLSIDSVTEIEKAKSSIHIAIGPTKQIDRMEWFVEKATEIGVTEISLIGCKNQERTKIKTERLQKRAIAALKQSQRLFLPLIHDLIDVKKFISKHPNGLIAHCYEDGKNNFESVFKSENCPILIGPEGDFTIEEIKFALQNGYKTITLGENRLRTETAGLYACMRAKLLIE